MSRACEALGLPRATAYRRLRPPLVTCVPPPKPSHRRIPDAEREAILAVLDSERFVDQPPREVYGGLLSEGRYLCAWRTMYRFLAERGPVRERRNQREPRHHTIPRFTASAPNAVWSWDISKLATCERGVACCMHFGGFLPCVPYCEQQHRSFSGAGATCATGIAWRRHPLPRRARV